MTKRLVRIYDDSDDWDIKMCVIVQGVRVFPVYVRMEGLPTCWFPVASLFCAYQVLSASLVFSGVGFLFNFS